jgi:hypothetical protein
MIQKSQKSRFKQKINEIIQIKKDQWSRINEIIGIKKINGQESTVNLSHLRKRCHTFLIKMITTDSLSALV